MIHIATTDIKEFLTLRENLPVIDVRSPAEFLKGHIAGASNIPLFSDEERKIVGTLYKQKSREQAVLKGLELVGPKMKDLALAAKTICPQKEALVYCWRGGLRSYSYAWLLALCGIQAQTLVGGYKSYRRYLKKSLSQPANIWILGGMTGSGKTEKLLSLAKKGQQVLDLEKYAHHKGSAFGHLGEANQQANEQFENIIGEKWLEFDLSQPIWIEDEGKSIGRNYVPDELFMQMRVSPVIKIQVPLKYRLMRLTTEYAAYEKDLLIERIHTIHNRLGGQHAKAAIKAVEDNDFEKAAELILVYYDKAYNHGLAARGAETIFTLDLPVDDADKNAEKIIEFQKEVQNGKHKADPV